MKRIILILCALFCLVSYCYGQENDADTVVIVTSNDSLFSEGDSFVVVINNTATILPSSRVFSADDTIAH
jgi:hypothetical protein